MDERADRLSRAGMATVDRRDFIRKALKVGSVAYVAPMILASVEPVSAQAAVTVPGNPNPECVGATCTTFKQCSSNPDCVCTTTSTGGGFCVPGSTQCNTLTACGAGNSCPAGSLCVLNSCCSGPVCVPTSLTCPPSGASGASYGGSSSGNGPTLGSH
jgi:hypothetical protein